MRNLNGKHQCEPGWRNHEAGEKNPHRYLFDRRSGRPAFDDSIGASVWKTGGVDVGVSFCFGIL